MLTSISKKDSSWDVPSETQAKVCHFGSPVPVQQDVGTLNVTVKHLRLGVEIRKVSGCTAGLGLLGGRSGADVNWLHKQSGTLTLECRTKQGRL